MRLRLVVAVLSLAAFASCSPRAPSGAAVPSPYPVATGDYPMLGHAVDYSWFAGKVERDLECIYLEFGDRRRSPWGGRIALALPPEMDGGLRQGDTLIVKGELTRLAYGSCGAPSYDVSSIEEH